MATLAIGAAAAAGVGACSPITTQLKYSPSDGSRLELGDEVTISNLLVLTTGQDEQALVVGGVTNHSSDNIAVALEFSGAEGAETVTVNVAGGGTTLLNPANPDGELVVLPSSPAALGANLSVAVSTPASGSASMNVTVLDGKIEPYGEYLEYLDGASQ